jgi:hypothetical protein
VKKEARKEAGRVEVDEEESVLVLAWEASCA